AGEIIVSGLSVDSRQVAPGHVFFALAGAKTDGSRFIDQAVSKGAVAIVGEHVPQASISVPFVVAANARQALARSAARFFS
ncbi:Mur ligase domain-containing protein, partial [Streptococcus pneumoniae]|uniref:Mur ligase domain-containing protein n=1 Tax=Streptococcus pneumoniae TaxID=1313 RepID=UPI001EF872CF